jgi:hypothetical protein
VQINLDIPFSFQNSCAFRAPAPIMPLTLARSNVPYSLRLLPTADHSEKDEEDSQSHTRV